MTHIIYIFGFLLANFMASLQSGSFAKSGIKQIDSYKMPPVKTPTATYKESLPKVLLPAQSLQIYPADDYDINTGVKKYSNSTRVKCRIPLTDGG